MTRLYALTLTTLFIVMAASQAVHAEPDPLIQQQRELAQSARTILEDWRAQGQGDERKPRPLIIALFTGSDTDPAPQYRERLTRTMQHIQAYYAKEMDRHGFGKLTFPLELEDDNLLKIHVVKGDQPNDAYSGKSGGDIRKMTLKHLAEQGIDGNKETMVIFCNLTKWDPVNRKMSHHSPYYAGGSHRSGTAWQLDSVLLDAAELENTDPKLKLHDGQYGHITLGRYQSIFVGGVCHELGHALGLPHNKQRPDEQKRWGTALMGSGNFNYGEELRDAGKGAFLTLTHAMKLAAHPAFSGSVKQMNQRPNSKYTELTLKPINEGKGVRLTGQVQSDIPIHAVIAYLDPEGGSDYDATTHVAVPDKDGRFTIDCTSFAKQKGKLRLVRVHANGWAKFAKDIATNYTRDNQGILTIDPFNLNEQRTDLATSSEVHAIQSLEDICECCRPSLD